MTEVHHGLEGVIAFESEIAEPDKEGRPFATVASTSRRSSVASRSRTSGAC